MFKTLASIRTFGAALSALTIAGASLIGASSADARPYHRHYRGGGVSIGAGIIGGLALGALATRAYAAPVSCWVERQVVFDRYGRRFVRPVRVCG